MDRNAEIDPYFTIMNKKRGSQQVEMSETQKIQNWSSLRAKIGTKRFQYLESII